MDAPLIQVREVQKRFGKIEALWGVDFSVSSGEIFALLGPNGAGKTTLISIICALIPPDGGDGRNIL
jgi:ABC-2 type transport system ATP-binding protein